MTGLFWNINGLDRRDAVAALCREHAVNLLMLVECKTKSAGVIDSLAAAGLPGFICPPGPTGNDSELKIFVRRLDAELQDVIDNPLERFTIRRLVFETAPELLLAVAHLPSKLHARDADQEDWAATLARSIAAEEDRLGHSRTILVGDLNMHPFEAGVVNANCLHGVMTREIAYGRGRKIRGEHSRYFYNPMWELYGGREAGCPGTFYRRPSGQTAYFWHMYDQVLVRPDSVDSLDDLRILTRIGSRSLLNAAGHPNTRVGSDHLPLSFTLAWG